MASFSLIEWALYANGSWGSWNESFSGETYISDETGRHILYKVRLDLGTYASLNSFKFTTRIHGSSNNPNTNLRVRLLDANPMVTSSYNTLADGTWSGTSPIGGISVTYTFQNLNLNTSKNYFLYITDNNTHASFQDYLMHAYAAISETNYTENKPLTLSLSSTSITTGNNQVVTIGNGAGRTITVSVKYGDTNLYSAATSTGSLTIPVTADFFSRAGITAASSFSVSVTIDADSTLYESFTVIAGSDMKPTVSGLATEIVQSGNAATYFPNTYLANISKCKVSVTVATKAGATIPTGGVKLTYPGGAAITMSYDSGTGKYTATTPALTADTAFTVTVTDSRSLTGYVTSSTITVVPYTKPVVNIDSGLTFRCDENGNEESGGAYWKARAVVTYYSALSGNGLLVHTVGISGQAPIDFTSGAQTSAQGGALNPTTAYMLVFTVQDKVSEAITKSIRLESITRNVVFKRNASGTTVGVGTTPTKAAGSSVEVPLAGEFLMGGIPAQAFYDPYSDDLYGSSFGKDFLNVNAENRHAPENAATFFFRQTSALSEWSNAPTANDSYNWRGYRFVLWFNIAFQMVVVIEFYPYPGRIWTNYHNSTSGWNGWRYTQALTPST
ncbi:MAG: hypothetical protein IJV40_03535 [Oscillospiraceae bacterium]|nr:hypothetical protein [Oscillospiraceae bacterium]